MKRIRSTAEEPVSKAVNFCSGFPSTPEHQPASCYCSVCSQFNLRPPHLAGQTPIGWVCHLFVKSEGVETGKKLGIRILFLFILRSRRRVVSADKEIHQNGAALLGQPGEWGVGDWGGLPVRKKEGFSQSLIY